jgi:Winged helix DNA-binding domain
MSLGWREVRARRLRRSLLAARVPAAGLVDAVGQICGLQAQVMAAAEIGIGIRVRGATRSGVRRALWEDRTLVKTWTLRGTLHLHPARELGMWLAARRATRSWREGQWYAEERLSEREAGRLLDAIGAALDGRCLTRAELAESVREILGSGIGDRITSGYGHVLGPAAITGMICHGPPRGVHATFVRVDQWLDTVDDPQPDAALAAVARRFLTTYGPGTPRTFREWFRLEREDAEAAFRSLRRELVTVDMGGREAFLLAGDEADVARGRSVRLMPEYDAHLMGFRQREHLLPKDAKGVIAAHPRGRLEGPAPVPWLLINGMVAGSWSRNRTGRAGSVEVRPFRPLSRTALAQVERERLAMERWLES